MNENDQSSSASHSDTHGMSIMSSYPETSQSIFNMLQLKNLDVWGGREDEISPPCIDRTLDKYV